MLTPRICAAAIPRAAALACLLLLLASTLYAQTSERQDPAATTASSDTARGVQLLQNKQYREAVEMLRSAVKQKKDDAVAWYHLGLALYQTGDVKGAREALETTIKLKPDDTAARSNLSYVLLFLGKRDDARKQAEQTLKLNPQIEEAHYVVGAVHFLAGERNKALEHAEAALRINKAYAPALMLKARSLMEAYAFEGHSLEDDERAERKSQLKEAAESLELYLNANPTDKDADVWREQLEALRFYAGASSSPKNTFSSREVTSKVRILSRPAPQYPGNARSWRASGTVVLRAVFAADGKVKYIRVIRSPDNELTIASVRAARQIKFTPAVKDGKPVSQHIQIEYNYNVN